MSLGTLALYIGAFLLGVFVLSGVIPTLRDASRRFQRVQEFASRYSAWVKAGSVGDEDLAWLIAHKDQVQRDAQRVGHGVTYVSPPPALGGGSYAPHQMFADLFSRQSYTDHITPDYRIETLLAVASAWDEQHRLAVSRLVNPFAWIRLAFERVVRFPRYLLKTAGFPENVTDSTGARIVTVLWGLLVGAATIGSFVLMLLRS